MTTDRVMDFVYYGLILLLPLSALAARRIPLGQAARMALIWVAIFAAGYLVIAQRDRFSDLIGRRDAIQGSARIPMAEDGHFWANVRINGTERRMLIDSGATTTALSTATAKAAGLDLEESPFPRMIDTANGSVLAQHTTIPTLTIGSITMTDVGAISSSAFGDQDVIGMNVLDRLEAWRVERGVLILNP